MPDNTPSNATPISATMANMVVTQTTKQLKQSANEQFQRLVNQQKNMSKMHSDLDALMARYNVNNSFISRASDWYGKKSWWVKLGIGTIVVGMGVLVGTLLNMVILLSFTAFITYSLFSFLLTNHYNASLLQRKKLAEDIVAMESSLANTVGNLSVLEEQLKNILLDLCQQNAQLADETVVYEKQIDRLNKRIETFSETIKQLEATKEELLITQQTLKNDLGTAIQDLQAAQTDLSKKITELSDVTDGFSTTASKFAESSEKFADIDKQSQENMQQLQLLEMSVQAQFDQLQAKAAALPQLKEEASEIIAEADAIIQRNDQQIAEITEKKKQNEKENSALMARVAAQLTAACTKKTKLPAACSQDNRTLELAL